jgi:hypothetical protein
LTALLISSAAIIITIFLYAKQPVQLFLRTAAIVLMYLLASNITLRINTREKQSSPIVIIDHSMSMKEHLAHILDLVSHIDVPHELLFSQESLLTQQEPEKLGSYTDISTMIEQAIKRNPARVVLITDGNHNFGASPITKAEESNIPIYIYGIGEERTRDISITNVRYPDYAYRGDSTRIEVITETGGFEAGTGEVVLQSATGGKIASQSLHLSNITAKSDMKFTYIPAEPGVVKFKVYTLPQPGEISYDNNEYTFSINVLDEKIRVLYYTDHISFNTKFMLRSLAADPHLTITAIARLGASGYQMIESGAQIARLPALADYEVLMLDNTILERLPWRDLPGLVNAGKGVVISGTTDGVDASWREMLPIGTASGSIQGTFRLEIVEPFSVLAGDDIPPVKNVNRIIAAKNDAVIIARVNNLPLIGYRLQGRGKIFQLCVVDLGTWHFLQSGLKGEPMLRDLLSDMVRFVSPLGDYGRLVLTTNAKECGFGQTVQFVLQSYDRNFRRAGGGDFFLVAGGHKIPFYETAMGRYEADFVADKEGTTEIQAQGKLQEEALTSNMLSISVHTRSLESEHRLNYALLQRIALGSRGEFHALDDLEEMALPEKTDRKISTVLNLNSPFIYFLVLFLLILDWILRRRRGVT